MSSDESTSSDQSSSKASAATWDQKKFVRDLYNGTVQLIVEYSRRVEANTPIHGDKVYLSLIRAGQVIHEQKVVCGCHDPAFSVFEMPELEETIDGFTEFLDEEDMPHFPAMLQEIKEAISVAV